MLRSPAASLITSLEIERKHIHKAISRHWSLSTFESAPTHCCSSNVCQRAFPCARTSMDRSVSRCDGTAGGYTPQSKLSAEVSYEESSDQSFHDHHPLLKLLLIFALFRTHCLASLHLPHFHCMVFSTGSFTMEQVAVTIP